MATYTFDQACCKKSLATMPLPRGVGAKRAANWNRSEEQPENDSLIGDLALINMALGDKASALALAERAMATNPMEKDALNGPMVI